MHAQIHGLTLLHNQIPGLYRQILIGKRKLERISFLRRALILPDKNKAAIVFFSYTMIRVSPG